MIFSDASVPGEGEHKILDHIRKQRALEGYNPNTRHCIYGADADLIMLGLSTHDPHFYIIRESVTLRRRRRRNQPQTQEDILREAQAQSHNMRMAELTGRRFTVEFSFVTISIIREFLEEYLKPNFRMSFDWDLERVIDDFVLLCFFAGNDFLPHLPALNIRQGGIEVLMHLYQRLLPSLGGYLTENGELNLNRLELFLREFSFGEEEILRMLENEKIRIVKILLNFCRAREMCTIDTRCLKGFRRFLTLKKKMKNLFQKRPK